MVRTLRPSSAHRWLNCEGSVALCEGLPDESGPAAREGSAAHKLLETCLKADESDAAPYLGVHCDEEFPWNSEMVDGVNVALQAISQLRSEDDQIFVEREVVAIPPTFGWQVKGTSDLFLWTPRKKRLVVLDFKYGFGLVEPGSEQLSVYGNGAAKFLRSQGEALPEEVTQVVVQPRGIHPEGPVRSTTYSFLEWLAFDMRLNASFVRHMMGGELPLTPGPWCKHCPAMRHDKCTAKQEQLNSVFYEIEQPFGADDVNLDLFGARLDRAESVAGYIKALQERAEELARAGKMPTGRKWVRGNNTPRKWTKSPAEVIADVKARTGVDITETGCPSPTVAEKLIGKNEYKKIADLVESKPGKPRLVSVSEPGEAIDPNGGANPVFGEVS